MYLFCYTCISTCSLNANAEKYQNRLEANRVQCACDIKYFPDTDVFYLQTAWAIFLLFNRIIQRLLTDLLFYLF